MTATIDELKVEKDNLQLMVNQYARRVLELERSLLLLQQAPRRPATVVSRLLVFMVEGCKYKPRELSQILGIPLNTVHVTIRRHPQYFQRVSHGVYTKVM